MRLLAVLLCALCICATACCGDMPTARLALPSVDVPPPVSFHNDPKFVPSGYVQQVQTVAPQFVPVQQYAAPAASPCAPIAAPQYSQGYQYAAPPPVPVPPPPAAAGPCR